MTVIKWIAAATVSGWAGIVWLAWYLANERVRFCYPMPEENCLIRTTAARDAVLVWGLTIGLVLMASGALAWTLWFARLSHHPMRGRPATQAEPTRKLP